MITVLLFVALMVWIAADHLKVMEELRRIRAAANAHKHAETHSQ